MAPVEVAAERRFERLRRRMARFRPACLTCCARPWGRCAWTSLSRSSAVCRAIASALLSAQGRVVVRGRLRLFAAV